MPGNGKSYCLPRPFGRGLIEAHRGRDDGGRVTSFRDRSVAASLKHRLAAAKVEEALNLPRPFGRGLIEAIFLSSPTNENTDLPRPFGRGLIEARRVVAASNPSNNLPRPFGRGLIEAQAFSKIARGDRTFRDRSVAASLKHRRRAALQVRAPCLPRPFGRGLIEAWQAGR